MPNISELVDNVRTVIEHPRLAVQMVLFRRNATDGGQRPIEELTPAEARFCQQPIGRAVARALAEHSIWLDVTNRSSVDL